MHLRKDVSTQPFPVASSEAVSYTHLDVYKRQVLIEEVSVKACFLDIIILIVVLGLPAVRLLFY